MKRNSRSASKAWLAFGSLVALGITILVVKELPAMRREWRIMKM
jgi:hypothetical protein